ncbi:MAG: NUDIX domain-containing protein [Acidimicrobiia bacterium]|nr:NUDIX domain-containing protein [Acidimicrobiia bacterium]
MRSAGLLPYRTTDRIEVMLAHPGGPFFANKDIGAWSIVKGLVEKGESDEAAAAREFEEETGWQVGRNGWLPLGETTLRSRKTVVAWALDQDFDPLNLVPGTFTMYGRQYPEIDRVEWMRPEQARAKLNPAQVVFIDRLVAQLGLNGDQQ